MNAIQCPRCELRFPTRSELEDHLAVDHRSERAERRAPEPARTTAPSSRAATAETSTQ
jgi:hypothetical protein